MLFFEIDIEQKLTKLYSQSFFYNPFLMYSQGGDHALLKASLQYKLKLKQHEKMYHVYA